MPRRQQVEYRPPTANLEPIASPTSRPFAPRLGPETILPVQELAGLSRTLTGIVVQQREEQGKLARSEGLSAAEGAPPDVLEEIRAATAGQNTAEGKQKALQDQFAALVKSGKIHVSEDPWAHVGWVEGMSHRLMAGYDQKLTARLGEATATQDADGNPVVAKDPDAIIAEVWAEYKDNPLLTNYYGANVARQMKSRADESFTGESAKQLGENRVKDTATWYTNTLNDKMFGLAVSGQEPTAETWEQLRATTQELYRKTGGLVDIPQVLMAAAQGAAARQEAVDDGSGAASRAAELLRDLRDAPSGATTLGKDSRTAPQLERLIEQYETEYAQKQGKAAQKDADQDRKAIADGLRLYHTMLDAAKEGTDGTADPKQIGRRFADRVRESNEFGDRTGLVIAQVEGATLASGERQGALLAAQVAQELEIGGNAAVAEHTITNLYTTGAVDRQGFESVMNLIAKKSDARPFIEGSAASLADHRSLEVAAKIPGLPEEYAGEIGVQEQGNQRALISDYSRREVEAMSEIAALPQTQQREAERKWRAENTPKLEAALRENSLKFVQERNAARAKVHELLLQAQSPAAFIEENRRYFATDEVERWRADTVVHTDYESMTESPAYQRSAGLSIQTVANQFKDDPDQAILVDIARRAHHDFFVEGIGNALAGQDPAKRNAIVAQLSRDITDQVIEEVNAQKVARFEQAAEVGGETVTEAKELTDFAANDLGKASRVTQDPTTAAAEFTAAPSRHVSEDLAEMQAAFFGGERKYGVASKFGTPFGKVKQSHLVDRAFVETKALLDDPNADPAAVGQAAVDMRLGTLIPAEEALAGKLTVQGSDDWKQRTSDFLNRSFFMFDLASVEKYKLVKAESDRAPVTVDISKAKIPPYTTAFFRTEAELDLWADTRPADFRALADKFGVLGGDRALKTFYNFQRQAIQRLNQE